MNKELQDYIESVSAIKEINVDEYTKPTFAVDESQDLHKLKFKLEREFNYELHKLESGDYTIYKMTDYHDFCTIDTPKEERVKFNIGDIYSNEIECLKCGDRPRSKNRRHFAWCKCESVAVDGGSNYCRIIGDSNNYKMNTILFNDIEEK